MAEYIETLDSMLDTAYEFVANEDLGQAWFILKRLQAEYPEVAEVWALMGDIWMIDGDLEYALEFYDRAVELDEIVAALAHRQGHLPCRTWPNSRSRGRCRTSPRP